MIKLTAERKFIDTKEIKYLLTQGEKNADMIQIVIGAGNNDVDISGCSFTMRTVASEGSMTETVLSKLVVEGNINLIWIVPDTATAIAGMLRLELVGVKNDEVIIKFKMPPIYVKEAVMGSNVPLPDIMDENLDQMHKLLEEMRDIAGELPEGINMIDEIKNARKGVFSACTYNTLGQRLAAEFNSCIQKEYFENRLSTEIRLANNSGVGRLWRDADGVAMYGEVFGDYEHNEASRENSHAEGVRTVASAYGGAHAEGNDTKASGFASHAEGCSNIASGLHSHAEGEDTEASGENAHSEGEGTIASNENQHVQGRYNIRDDTGKYSFIIGNGTRNRSSNALTLDWDGNLWTAGDVTATDSDGNNVSLCETARIMRDSLGMIKSKNLLKNTAGTTTQNGITFTYNDDGSVTCNGTATANADYIYKITLPQNSSFILSGCPTGGSKSTYSLFARDTATWSIVYFDTGSSRTVKTGNYTTWQVVIRISNGQTVNDMTFYPMLRNADIYADDAEYEPYSDDLQTQINDLNADSGWIRATTNSSGGEAWYRKCGKTVEFRCAVVLLDSGITEWDFCTLPEGCRPSAKIVTGVATVSQNDNLYKMQISKSGVVTIFTSNETGLPIRSTYMIHACFLTD